MSYKESPTSYKIKVMAMALLLCFTILTILKLILGG